MKLRTARIVVWSMMAAVVLSGLIALFTQSPIAYILMGAALAAELIVFFIFIMMVVMVMMFFFLFFFTFLFHFSYFNYFILFFI